MSSQSVGNKNMAIQEAGSTGGGGGVDSSSVGAAGAAMGGDPEYVDLHELAKGWKAALSWASDPATRHEARRKNDRGNLPLHSAASFRAPCEVIGE